MPNLTERIAGFGHSAQLRLLSGLRAATGFVSEMFEPESVSFPSAYNLTADELRHTGIPNRYLNRVFVNLDYNGQDYTIEHNAKYNLITVMPRNGTTSSVDEVCLKVARVTGNKNPRMIRPTKRLTQQSIADYVDAYKKPESGFSHVNIFGVHFEEVPFSICDRGMKIPSEKLYKPS